MGCVQNYDILLVDALTHYDTLMTYNITMFNAIWNNTITNVIDQK